MAIDSPAPPLALAGPSLEGLQVRMVVSPMGTAVASLYEVVAGLSRGADERWVRMVLRRARGLDLAPLEVYGHPDYDVPDCLWPIATHSDPTLEEELEAVRATPVDELVEQVRKSIGDDTVPPEFRPYLRAPRVALDAYCRAFEDYWRAVVAPSWTVIKAALESEVQRVARQFVTEGPSAVITGLHPRLRYQPDSVGSRPLVLMPLASGPDVLMYSSDSPEFMAIAYGSPGMGDLFGRDEPAPGQDLARLLGGARAGIVASLSSPATTVQLAAALGYAPSTISAHLGTLRTMGLVRRTRIGRFVFYERTERAERILAAYKR